MNAFKQGILKYIPKSKLDKILHVSATIAIILLIASITFTLLFMVPVIVEISVAQNLNGGGANNRGFYFFYLLTPVVLVPFFENDKNVRNN